MKKIITLFIILCLPIAAMAEKPMAVEVGKTLRNGKGEEVFLFDWYKQAAFKQRWHEQIGKHAPKIPMHNWVRKMAGPMPPLEEVLVNHKKYYYTTMCQPHNCGANRMYILILSDKQRMVAYHVVYDDDEYVADKPSQTYVYGKPNAAELGFLKNEWHKEHTE